MAKLGNKVLLSVTAKQNSATAILRGQVALWDTATDNDTVLLCAADNAPKVAGIAIDDSPGQDKEMALAVVGVVLCKASGAITQGNEVIGAANGGIKARAAEAVPVTTIGTALATAASGDLIPVLLGIHEHIAAI